MQIELKRLQRESGITTVMVTHDQEEAMTMADRIAVLDHGRVQQLDAPTLVYDRPVNPFVNQFIGSSNVLKITLKHRDATTVKVGLAGGGELALDSEVCAAGGLGSGRPAMLCVRPECFTFSDSGPITGRVLLALPLGGSTLYDVDIDGGDAVKVAVARRPGSAPLAEGSAVRLSLIRPDACSVFPFSSPV